MVGIEIKAYKCISLKIHSMDFQKTETCTIPCSRDTKTQAIGDSRPNSKHVIH